MDFLYEIYIGDLRTVGPTKEAAWTTSHFIASRINYLGHQDTPRKRRPQSITPGDWAGSMC